jgi:hypothetical protein
VLAVNKPQEVEGTLT